MSDAAPVRTVIPALVRPPPPEGPYENRSPSPHLCPIKGRRTQLVYDIVFNLIFWTCGAFCTMNVYFREAPYHLLPTDFLTSYVHIPAWQSWLVWRRFVRSPSCVELLARVQSSEDGRAKLNLASRLGGWLVLLLQCAMIVDGLLGFSLPGTLHVMNGDYIALRLSIPS